MTYSPSSPNGLARRRGTMTQKPLIYSRCEFKSSTCRLPFRLYDALPWHNLIDVLYLISITALHLCTTLLTHYLVVTTLTAATWSTNFLIVMLLYRRTTSTHCSTLSTLYIYLIAIYTLHYHGTTSSLSSFIMALPYPYTTSSLLNILLHCLFDALLYDTLLLQ